MENKPGKQSWLEGMGKRKVKEKGKCKGKVSEGEKGRRWEEANKVDLRVVLVFVHLAMAFEGLRLEALRRECAEWGGEEG